MSRTPTPPSSPDELARPASRRRWVLPSAAIWAGLILVLAGTLAYWNSLKGPFVFDDASSITRNPSIQQGWNLGPSLRPPANSTTAGRPLVNLTLAVNYALGGEAVGGYHVFNLGVHLLAGLALLGLLRRTLASPVMEGTFGRDAGPLALAMALLWLLHPLQTESVTYVVQRAESLMGLCYLLTLYAFVRSTAGPAAGWWRALTVFSCLMGMACKEVIVSAPLVVLFYDRTFLAGTFRKAWRERRGLYLALAATWWLLGMLVASAGDRADTAGFATTIGVGDYALTQVAAVIHYLKLALWPAPLVFDYGTGVVTSLSAVGLQAVILAGMLAGTVLALCRRPVLGLAGLWFFAILAPSSSVVPIATQTMAEHRMYLPLAAIVALAGTGLYRLMGRRSLGILYVLAAVLGGLTIARNADYRSALALWADTAQKVPENTRALNTLGVAQLNAGQPAEARASFEAALKLRPGDPAAHNNLGNLLSAAGRFGEAIPHYEAALRQAPGVAVSWFNLAHAQAALGLWTVSVSNYRQSLKLDPAQPLAFNNIGAIFFQTGRANEAMAEFGEALRLQPNDPAACNNLGQALAAAGRAPEALGWLERAAKLDPSGVEAQFNLGSLLLRLDRPAEAIAPLAAVVRLKPDYAEAHNHLGIALARQGRVTEAIGHFETALRLKPDFAEAARNLALIRAGPNPP